MLLNRRREIEFCVHDAALWRLRLFTGPLDPFIFDFAPFARITGNLPVARGSHVFIVRRGAHTLLDGFWAREFAIASPGGQDEVEIAVVDRSRR